MKKIFTLLFAGALLFSCTKAPQPLNEISFGTSNVISKAIIENTTFPNADFGVFADVNAVGKALTTEGTDFMENDKYTKSESTITAETPKYWIPDTQTQFYAYYPYGSVSSYELAVNTTAHDEACIDVLWAKPSIVTYNSEDDAPGAVSLNFQHTLAFLEFQVKSGTIVSAVKINSLTFTTDNTADFNVKTGVFSNKGGNSVHTFTKTSGITSSYSTLGKVLLIPQDVVAITINYTASIFGYEFANKSRTIPVDKLGVASWDGGKKYIYKISIDSSDIISFSTSVSNWQSGTEQIIY